MGLGHPPRCTVAARITRRISGGSASIAAVGWRRRRGGGEGRRTRGGSASFGFPNHPIRRFQSEERRRRFIYRTVGSRLAGRDAEEFSAIMCIAMSILVAALLLGLLPSGLARATERDLKSEEATREREDRGARGTSSRRRLRRPPKPMR